MNGDCCLGSCFLRGLLDTISSNTSLFVCLRKEIQVSFRNVQTSMSSNNISVLHIFVIELAKFPVGRLLPLSILELGNLSENSNFLDEVL